MYVTKLVSGSLTFASARNSPTPPGPFVSVTVTGSPARALVVLTVNVSGPGSGGGETVTAGQVLAILADVARAHPDVLSDPEPEIYFQGFGENSLNFEVRAWTESPRGFLPVRSEVGVASLITELPWWTGRI